MAQSNIPIANPPVPEPGIVLLLAFVLIVTEETFLDVLSSRCVNPDTIPEIQLSSPAGLATVFAITPSPSNAPGLVEPSTVYPALALDIEVELELTFIVIST